jgi:hypothetical protein
LIVRPALLDSDATSFDKPFLAEALAELHHKTRERRGCRAAKQTNDRYRRLLRASRERPRRSSAAEQRDELAAFHVAPLSWQLAQQLLRNPYDVVFAVVQAR